MEAAENKKVTVMDKIIYINKEPVERKLLDIENLCVYLSIGETQARKMLKSKDCQFSLRIGNRLYANKDVLDKWIDEKTGNK